MVLSTSVYYKESKVHNFTIISGFTARVAKTPDIDVLLALLVFERTATLVKISEKRIIFVIELFKVWLINNRLFRLSWQTLGLRVCNII